FTRFGAVALSYIFFFFSSRRRHTRSKRDWSSDVCSSDLIIDVAPVAYKERRHDEILAALKAVNASNITDRREAAELMREYITEGEFVIQFLLKSFRDGKFRFNVPILDEKYDTISGWNPIPRWDGKAFFVIGGDSGYVTREYQAEVQTQLPNSSAIVIAGAGHWVHAQKTDSVVNAILNFLAKNE